jgi:mannose/fructose-specific phosphotransferase system component IIA
MIRGVVFTHVDLGHALRHAVEAFLGPQEEFVSLSNEGLSSEQMLQSLDEAVAGGVDGSIVFSTLFGGSCWQTAERLRRQQKRIRHITGVNLPMLLAFVNKREKFGLDALAELLVEYGRKGIQS